MPLVPLLWPSIATPCAEIEGIKILYAHLTGLQCSIDSWEAALLLYQTAIRPPPSISRAVASRWRFLACGECVFELYHLRARLEKIQSVLLRKCPSLRPFIDIPRLRAARKQLDGYFPDIESLRHAIAHKGENEAYPEIHAPDGLFALTGFREADVVSIPYEGKLGRLAITSESLERMSEVVVQFVGAFEHAAAQLKSQGHLE